MQVYLALLLGSITGFKEMSQESCVTLGEGDDKSARRWEYAQVWSKAKALGRHLDGLIMSKKWIA